MLLRENKLGNCSRNRGRALVERRVIANAAGRMEEVTGCRHDRTGSTSCIGPVYKSRMDPDVSASTFSEVPD